MGKGDESCLVELMQFKLWSDIIRHHDALDLNSILMVQMTIQGANNGSDNGRKPGSRLILE